MRYEVNAVMQHMPKLRKAALRAMTTVCFWARLRRTRVPFCEGKLGQVLDRRSLVASQISQVVRQAATKHIFTNAIAISLIVAVLG